MKPINIYHCCVPKSASQWLKSVLSDKRVDEKSGMTVYTYQKDLPTKGDPRKYTERHFDRAMPEQRIVSPLYMDYASYLSIPKPPCYRTFFVMRDPRDIIVSWYFSVKYSHPLMGKILEHRQRLHEMNLKDGLRYCMDYLDYFGLYNTLESWFKADTGAEPIKIIRFENLADREKQAAVLHELFSYCRISLSKEDIGMIQKTYSFDRLKQKHSRGPVSPFRKGRSGDWKNYFDQDLELYFRTLTKNLAGKLGYGV